VYVSEDGQVGEAEIPPAATSYVVSNLTPGTSYTITLAAERGLKRSTPVTVSASTGGWGAIAVQNMLYISSEHRTNEKRKVYSKVEVSQRCEDFAANEHRENEMYLHLDDAFLICAFFSSSCSLFHILFS